MRRLIFAATLVGATPLAAVGAQSLASRVVERDGVVQVIYPSRPEACGDGRGSFSHMFGDRDDHGEWSGRPCVHGPARVSATVVGGEVTRLRAYVGPVPRSDDRTINASAAEARAWLTQVVEGGTARLSRDAIVPLVLADSTDPWPILLRVAHSDARPLAVRRDALMWLGMGVDHHLGIDGAGDTSEDDEMARQAVFVLSQRAKRDGVAELMEAARTSKRPAVRRDAIFWLGQVGDPNAVADLFAALLGGR